MRDLIEKINSLVSEDVITEAGRSKRINDYDRVVFVSGIATKAGAKRDLKDEFPSGREVIKRLSSALRDKYIKKSHDYGGLELAFEYGPSVEDTIERQMKKLKRKYPRLSWEVSIIGD